MLTEAIEYPVEREDWLPTMLIGGGLWFAVVLLGIIGAIFLVFWFFIVTIPVGLFALLLAVVPYLLLMGFSITVSRAIMAGRELPPTFDDWGQYAKDGLYVFAISLVYGLPLLVVGLLAAVGIGIGAAVGGGEGSMLLVLTMMVTSFAGSVVGLVVLYFYPAALFNFARTGELGSILNVGEMRRITLDTDYAVAWGFGAVAWVAGQMIGDSLLFLLVGVFVYFYAQLVTTYLITRGGMDALGLEAPALQPAAAAALQPETPDEPADEIPTPPAGRLPTEPEEGVRPGTTAPTEPAKDPASTTGSAKDPASTTGSAEDPAAEDERDLEDVTGIGPSKAESLRTAGFETVADLRAASVADLAEIEGISPSLAERIKADAGRQAED